MAIELKMLLYTVVLFVVQLVLQGTWGIIQNGMGYALGAQDDEKASGGIGGRFERAYYNLLETMPPFAALILIGLYTGKLNEMTALGSQIYFWSRVAYVPAYVIGFPGLRTLIWAASLVGIIMILWQLLL